MTRDELIDLMGVHPYVESVIVCDTYAESLVIGPLVESIYGVAVTDWRGDADAFWKYIFLLDNSVNANRWLSDPEIQNANQIPASEFLQLATGRQLNSVAVDDLI